MHQLDHRLADDVRSPLRHVRTRLYFTSESHIHSAFNVLRWGHQYARAPGGQPCLSIFSDEARTMHVYSLWLYLLTGARHNERSQATMVLLTMVLLTMVLLTMVLLTMVLLTMVLLTMALLTRRAPCSTSGRSAT